MTYMDDVMINQDHEDSEAGYSLLEILVVLAIISLLATLVAPRLFSQLDKSKVTAAQAQIKTLKLALDTYRIDTGRMPSQTEGLNVLVTPPNDGQGNWYGPYLEGNIPMDPWGNAYIYQPGSVDENNYKTDPKIMSFGSDGQPGGQGDAADISY